LHQRPLLTLDEVITPQAGSCTIFARYVEAGFATQVILNARLTRFYEREDWKQRLKGAQGLESLLLERGISLMEAGDNPSMERSMVDEPIAGGASTIERAARTKLAELRQKTAGASSTKLKLVTVDDLRARRKARQTEINR
jgi:hypothetical protein